MRQPDTKLCPHCYQPLPMRQEQVTDYVDVRTMDNIHARPKIAGYSFEWVYEPCRNPECC